MQRHPAKTRAYKETTAQQLRSFYEAARLGSLSAAAAHLKLAAPTVWRQVRALERDLGQPLLKRHGRGCCLTEAGQCLADLAAPLVSGLASLKRHFHEAQARQTDRLVVAVTPRVLVEDLPPCVVEFRRRYPDMRLTLQELWEGEVFARVDAGRQTWGSSPAEAATT
jgi:DNA-binding transcriptional LysR family regulator